MIEELAQPLFSAAGVGSGRIKLFIIDNNSINTFVIDDHQLYGVG